MTDDDAIAREYWQDLQRIFGQSRNSALRLHSITFKPDGRYGRYSELGRGKYLVLPVFGDVPVLGGRVGEARFVAGEVDANGRQKWVLEH